MYKQSGLIKLPIILMFLICMVLPGPASAQAGWPPLEIETALQGQGDSGIFRYDILLTNTSDIDLIDVIISSPLPAGVTFNRFEAIDYATTSFDGERIAFTVLQLPGKTTIGPMSTYVEIQGVDRAALRTSFYAVWRGQMPGSVFVPDAGFGTGLAEATTPESAGAEPDISTPEPTEEVASGPEPTEEALPVEQPTTEAVAEVGTAQPSVDTNAGNGAEATPEPVPPEPSVVSFALWDMLDVLESHDFVDLTNTFAPGIPRWPGFPDAEFKTIYDYDTDGFFAQEFVHVGQYGTHVDAPSHFHEGLRSVDQIGLKEMLAPLVVINVADKVAANADYQLTVDDVKEWEAKYGPVPEGSFVAMRSDWSKRWPDVVTYSNKDESGQAHYPGWTVDALKYLYEERKIVGNGHETLDTDAAVAQNDGGFAAENYALGTDHYQVELMTNLDKVPEAGALVIVSVPKPEGGSGFPARVFAILP
jgi:kynurenine formamidase